MTILRPGSPTTFMATTRTVPVGVEMRGLAPAEKIQGVEVAFDGYFYKRFRYKAGDSYRPGQYRDAPVLIGHRLTLLSWTGRG